MHTRAAASWSAARSLASRSAALRRSFPLRCSMGSASAFTSSMPRSASSEKLQAACCAAASWRRPLPAPSPLQTAGHGHESINVTATAVGSGSGGNIGGGLSASAGERLRRSLSWGEWQRPLPWLRMPDELWGAVNALSAAASPAAEKPPRRGVCSVSTQAAGAAAVPAPSEMPEEAVEPPGSDLRQRLDYRPRLSNMQAALCATVAAAVCVLAYLLRHPAAVSVWYGAGMAVLFAGALLATRAALLEHEFTKRLVTEPELAGPHSRFVTLQDVKVHYVVEKPRQGSRRSAGITAVHCCHGFGANTFSWSFAQAGLAAALGATVTAHDMPGFGLTQRVNDSRAYTLECNGRLGRAVMEAEAAAKASSGNSTSGAATSDVSADDDTSGSSSGRSGSAAAAAAEEGALAGGGAAAVQAGGRVLVGHSLGAACVAAEAIAHPEGIAALVLVAPAIVALRLGRREAALEQRQEAEALLRGDKVGAAKARARDSEFRSNTASTLMQRIGGHRSTAVRLAAALGYAITASATRAALVAATPLLVLGLRASVRSRGFWERGLARAWHRKEGVTEAVVDNYRLPQLVRGWERGMLTFLGARATAGRSFPARLAAAFHGREAMTQVEQLLDAVTAHNIRVLIVHGEGDALVPAANSRRLASMLPDSRLVTLPRCGHNPQEELPEEFVEVVSDFLKGLDSPDAPTARNPAGTATQTA